MRKSILNQKLEKKNKKSKRCKFSIKKIKGTYGIGNNIFNSFSKKFGLNKYFNKKKAKVRVLRLMDQISFKLTFDKNLISELIKSRKYLTETVKNYKSNRHLLRYPVRGQRTKTNSSTRKKFKNKLQFLT